MTKASTQAANATLTTPTTLIPQTMITIAVDTDYVAAQMGKNISRGIYMMDNKVRNGSSGEGTLELSTVCANGNLIGFNVVPINSLGASPGKVVITGFTVSQGTVFTAAGQPRAQVQPATFPNQAAGSYWIGQALNQGSQTYQIQIAVTVGVLQPTTYYVNWDPVLTSK